MGGKSKTELGEENEFSPELHRAFMSLTPKERLREFQEAIKNLLLNIVRAGALIRAMEECGDDFEDLRACNPALFAKLRRIAYGQMLPGVLHIESGAARNAVAQLPLADQRHLLDGGAVQFLTQEGDTLSVSVQNLEPSMVRQVFRRGAIRTLAEQRAWLEDERLKALKHARVTPEADVRPHPKQGFVEVLRPCRLTRRDLAELMGKLS